MTDLIPLHAVKSDKMNRLLGIDGLKDLAAKMGNLEAIHMSDDNKVSGVGFISGTESFVFGVSLDIDVEAEIAEIEKEINRLTGFIGGIEKKLSNERFVSGAPEAVVNMERKKLADGQEKIKNLQSDIERRRNTFISTKSTFRLSSHFSTVKIATHSGSSEGNDTPIMIFKNPIEAKTFISTTNTFRLSSHFSIVKIVKHLGSSEGRQEYKIISVAYNSILNTLQLIVI